MAASQATTKGETAESAVEAEATTTAKEAAADAAAEAATTNMGAATAEAKAIAAQKERAAVHAATAPTKINHPKPRVQPGLISPAQPTTVTTTGTRADKLRKGKVPSGLPGIAGSNIHTPYDD